MNEKQAQAVVELVQDGFTKEALILAKAYNELPEGTEVLAMPRVFQLARSLIQAIFARFADNALTKFISRLAQMAFGGLSGEELEAAKRRSRRILMAALATVAVAVVLIVTALVLRNGKDQSEFETNIANARARLNEALKELARELAKLQKEVAQQAARAEAPMGSPQLPAPAKEPWYGPWEKM